MKIERINRIFKHIGIWAIAHRWYVIGLYLLLLCCGIYGSTKLYVTNSWNDYFLEDDPMIKETNTFKEVFGNENFAAVLLRSDSLFTYEKLALVKKLSQELEDSITYADGTVSLCNIEFIEGREEGLAIEAIMPDEIPTHPQQLEAIKYRVYSKPYIAERLLSRDGKSTWVFLKLRPFPSSEEPDGEHAEMLTGEQLRHIITKPEYTSLHPLGAGLPYMTYRKMEWIMGKVPWLLGLAILVALAVISLFTRNVRSIVVPMLTALSAIVVAYGIMGFLGMKIDSGMVMVPILLTFAVAVAYNIHLHTAFRRQMALHGKRKQAAVETIEHTGWSLLFSALTTFVALLSFLSMPIAPLHFVGVASSSCVLFAFLTALFLMPIAHSFGKDRKPLPPKEQKSGSMRRVETFFELLGHNTLRREKLIWGISLGLILFFGVGLFRIEVTSEEDRTMGTTIDYVAEIFKVAESEIGSLCSYDLMIKCAQPGDAKKRASLQALERVERKAQSFAQTKRTTSILNIIRDLNQTLENGQPEAYRLPESDEAVAQELLLYENAGGSDTESWIDYDYQYLRLRIENSSYNSDLVEKEMNDLVAYAQSQFPEATITPVGSVPIITTMIQYVARGQIYSFLLSLLVIGTLMMIVFGSFRIGLIGLIPNILPAIITGGLMGWLNYPLDMMIATVLPMVLGLSVDDTIHFFNAGHLEFNRHKSYKKVVANAFRLVGLPIVMTSLILCADFAVFFFGEATDFIHMGVLTIMGILTALLADLFITPLLFARFQIFGKETQPDNSPQNN